MARALLLAALLAAGCAAEGDRAGDGAPAADALPGAARLPPALRILTLNESHPTATPVIFDHGFHASPAAGSASCADCHHEVRGMAGRVPAACGSCHGQNFMAPDHDESKPHDHAGPPDV